MLLYTAHLDVTSFTFYPGEIWLSFPLQLSMPQDHRQGEPCGAGSRVRKQQQQRSLLDREELLGTILGRKWVKVHLYSSHTTTCG